MTVLDQRSEHPADSYRFGTFEVRAHSRLLLRDGMRVRIQDLPLRMLLVLIEHAGEVVSREQLRTRLWGDRTFVEFDSSLRVAAAKLREALGDDAAQPQYLETVARRGYRFIGEVLPVPEPAAAPQGDTAKPVAATIAAAVPQTGRRIHLPIASVIGMVALLAILASLLIWNTHRPLIGKQDAVAVGTFVNRTQDSSLDDMLSAPFRVKIDESPYLRLIAGDRFAQALRVHPNSGFQDELEACRQLHGRALLNGSLAHAGYGFEVRVNAYDCSQAKSLVSVTVKAGSQQDLLAALDEACQQMRLRLGEARNTLKRFNVPLIQATTHSLAALRAYRLGEQRHISGNETESKRYYKLAIDLDPQFALAYLQLGRAYSNTGEATLSRDYYRRAFELRQRTTDRERLHITTSYYSYATGEIERAIEAYQLWSTLYPQDVIPANNLAGAYLTIGRPQEALERARRAIEIDPTIAPPYAVLSRALLRTGHASELKTLCDDPARRATDSVVYHLSCYEGAFTRGDAAAMQRETTWARGKSQESVLIAGAAAIAFYQGRRDEAYRLFTAARQSAVTNNLSEYAARIGLTQATMEAEAGIITTARQDALTAFAGSSHGSGETISIALVQALIGDLAESYENVRKADALSPLNTLLSQAAVPEVLAIIDLKRREPQDALRKLEQARPYDGCDLLDLGPGYYRGLAYVQSGQPERAAAEFRAVISRRAMASHSLSVALSTLELAKILFNAGDNDAARLLVQELELTWRQADAGFRPLHDLRELSANLHEHAKSRYSHAQIDHVLWFWPQDEKPMAARHRVDNKLRFLAPFDPVVWDRRRFKLLWGWEYKLEAYVPAHKRRMGHYALPMLWGEQMLGWANLKVVDGRLQQQLGFAGRQPRDRAFQRAADEALHGMKEFLAL